MKKAKVINQRSAIQAITIIHIISISFTSPDTQKKYSKHLLQIENEFYSTIRPKRTTKSGETALGALWERGVEYIEVRCVDLNPFQPLGIDREQIDFMDVFLLTCLLSKSPATDDQEYRNILNNQRMMVYQGRNPDLMLHDGDQMRPFLQWSHALFDEMMPVAQLLDRHNQTEQYKQSGRYEQTLNKLIKIIIWQILNLQKNVLKFSKVTILFRTLYIHKIKPAVYAQLFSLK